MILLNQHLVLRFQRNVCEDLINVRRDIVLTISQRWASKAGRTGVGAISTASNGERDSTVTSATSGTDATRQPGGQRRVAYRERGSGGIGPDLRSGPSSGASLSPKIPRIPVSRRSNGGGDVDEDRMQKFRLEQRLWLLSGYWRWILRVRI